MKLLGSRASQQCQDFRPSGSSTCSRAVWSSNAQCARRSLHDQHGPTSTLSYFNVHLKHQLRHVCRASPAQHAQHETANRAADQIVSSLSASTAPSQAGTASSGSGSGSSSSSSWPLVRRTQLAGGVLEVLTWEGERCLRVWLPPGYSPLDAHRQPYPVLYLNDGQNLFGDCTTLSGWSWNAAHTAAAMMREGKVPPFIIVGIDHAGVLRSQEYTPCTPGTGPGGFRSDAASWPGGGVAAYLARIHNEIIPFISSNYAASSDPQDLAFGGSSFGGIAALVEGMKGSDGCAFGALLVESPSLWIGDPQPETFLEALQAYRGWWPQRIYIGMGGKEYSGTRGGAGQEHDHHFHRYLSTLYAKLTKSGLGPSRLAWTLEPDHAHTESAWAARFPAALQFIAGGWWQRWQERYANDLFFTVPRRLKAGLGGQLMFVNKQRSYPLAGVHGRLKLVMGRNGWQDVRHLLMQHVGQVQQLQLQPPRDLQEKVRERWRSEYQQQLRLQEEQRQRELAARREEERRRQQQQEAAGRATSNSTSGAAAASGKFGAMLSNAQQQQQQQRYVASGEELPAAQQQQQHNTDIDPTLQRILDQPMASCGLDNGDWFVVQLPDLPDDTYEVNFVLCDEAGHVYDNNALNDFYLPVRQQGEVQDQSLDESSAFYPGQQYSSSSSSSRPDRSAGGIVAAALSPANSLAVAAAFAGDACGFLEQDVDALVAAAAAARSPADSAAEAAVANFQLFFSLPPVPVADGVNRLWVNKAQLRFGLARAGKLKMHVGFNSWQKGRQEAPLEPSALNTSGQRNSGQPLDCKFEEHQSSFTQLELQPTALPRRDGVEWWSVDLRIPSDAVLCSFAFSAEVNGVERWDNNHGHNYHLPVRSVSASILAAAAEAAILAATVKKAPAKSSWRSNPWRANGSSVSSSSTAATHQTSSGRFSRFYNNENSSSYSSTGSSSSSSIGSSSSSSRRWLAPAYRPPPGFTVREVEACEAVPHAEGTLEVLDLKKRVQGADDDDSSSSSSSKYITVSSHSSSGYDSEDGSSKGRSKLHWWDEKRVRVWLPPGFKPEDAPVGGWPALIMCDGQNMFEDWLAHQGVSWNLGECASGLITSGAIPPCVCIAIDSAGPYRSYNYLPFAPGTGTGGFRQDCAKWPGGGAADFLDRVVHEILPMLQQRYNISQCPSRLAFGGGSFAGVTALMAATSKPHVFGSVLVESPSLWAAEGRFLQELEKHSGRLPERISIGCGTREYSATRDHERHDLDGMLTHQYHEAARILHEKGAKGPARFRFEVDHGAGHHESAWRWRLTEAFKFIAQGWWD